MDELNNIWNADDELNDDQLMDYIQGKSAGEDAHALEKKMNNSSFLNDAVEGLQGFSSAEKLNDYVQQINEDLHHRTHDKNKKNRRDFKSLSWEIIAAIIIVVLCVLGYAIITMLRN